MQNKKRRKKRGKAKNPWGLRRTIAVSLLAHGILIIAIVALGWRQFSSEKPGDAIFVNDVVIGGGENGATTHSPPLKIRGGGGSYATSGSKPNPSSADAKALADRRPPLNVRRGENGEGSDPNSTDGVDIGSRVGSGSGSGTGGAGNPVLAEIRRRIEQSKRYPMQARAQYIEGKVGVRFLIQPNGQVENVMVTHSSGARVLDEAAIQAVRHSAPLPYYENTIDLSLAFRLR